MKTFTKILASVIAIATLVLQAPAVQTVIGGFFSAHPNVSAILGGVFSILALVHQPSAPAK